MTFDKAEQEAFIKLVAASVTLNISVEDAHAKLMEIGGIMAKINEQEEKLREFLLLPVEVVRFHLSHLEPNEVDGLICMYEVFEMYEYCQALKDL